MASKVPERLTRAVELLEVEPGERILEVGCGPGVAAALICAALGGEGGLVAIDRSATAIERAAKRNPALLEAGALELRETDLAGFEPDGEPFDAALAVNVNLFWTGDAAEELTVLRRALRPGGRLLLAYEAPGGGIRPRVADAVDANLRAHGFEPGHIEAPPLQAIAGRLP